VLAQGLCRFESGLLSQSVKSVAPREEDTETRLAYAGRSRRELLVVARVRGPKGSAVSAVT
jgi:hypothetical protein